MGVKVMMMMMMMMSVFVGVCFAVTDLHRLQRLYSVCNGYDWLNNEHWNDVDVSICKWYGVQCDANNNTESLVLVNNFLYGRDCIVTDDIWKDWLSVKTLNLAENSFPGYISTTIGTMTNLEELVFAFNRDVYRVPTEIGNLSNLTILDLSGMPQAFEDYRFPTEIGNLQELTFLDLSHSVYDDEDENDYFYALPTYVGNLKNLQVLNLSDTGSKGQIPSNYENLQNLKYLVLSDNLLPQPLPSWIQDFTNLIHLDISGNGAVGTLEDYLRNVINNDKLQYLNVGHNSLTGTISTEIQHMTSLTAFGFAHNKFVGQLPTDIFANIPSLQYIIGGGNHFNGTLDDMYFCFSVEFFEFYSSQFDCPLPSCCQDFARSDNTQCGYTPCILNSS